MMKDKIQKISKEDTEAITGGFKYYKRYMFDGKVIVEYTAENMMEKSFLLEKKSAIEDRCEKLSYLIGQKIEIANVARTFWEKAGFKTDVIITRQVNE